MAHECSGESFDYSRLFRNYRFALLSVVGWIAPWVIVRNAVTSLASEYDEYLQLSQSCAVFNLSRVWICIACLFQLCPSGLWSLRGVSRVVIVRPDHLLYVCDTIIILIFVVRFVPNMSRYIFGRGCFWEGMTVSSRYTTRFPIVITYVTSASQVVICTCCL